MKTQSQLLSAHINRSMPPGTIIPELMYADVLAAVVWLCKAFGFAERLRIGSHRSQLCFGDGSIIVVGRSSSQSADSSGITRPEPSLKSESDHSLMVRVEDVDSHYERARQYGAQIVHPPADYAYGERQYTAEDLAGHRWTFSQTTADVDPSEWGGVLMGHTEDTI